MPTQSLPGRPGWCPQVGSLFRLFHAGHSKCRELRQVHPWFLRSKPRGPGDVAQGRDVRGPPCSPGLPLRRQEQHDALYQRKDLPEDVDVGKCFRKTLRS